MSHSGRKTMQLVYLLISASKNKGCNERVSLLLIKLVSEKKASCEGAPLPESRLDQIIELFDVITMPPIIAWKARKLCLRTII